MRAPGYHGPKTIELKQLADTAALADRVFFRGQVGMVQRYPLLYHPERLEQLRIIEHEGQPVSLVITALDDVLLLGCSLRVASIGSVCTDEAHRGHGLAGQLVDDAVERALAAGANLMMISGGRTLYRRRGAAPCTPFRKYLLDRAALPQSDPALRLEQVTVESAATAMRLYEHEAIRYRRSLDDFRVLISSGYVANRPGEVYFVYRDATPMALLAINRPNPSRDKNINSLAVVELAGSRRAVLHSLPGLCDRFEKTQVQINGYAGDLDLLDACAESGALPQPTAFAGTVKILDVQRLWQDYALLLTERLGSESFRALRLIPETDETGLHTLTFQRGEERVKIAGAAEIIAAFFGQQDLDPLKDLSGSLAETLRAVFPLPLPIYGLNYV